METWLTQEWSQWASPRTRPQTPGHRDVVLKGLGAQPACIPKCSEMLSERASVRWNNLPIELCSLAPGKEHIGDVAN